MKPNFTVVQNFTMKTCKESLLVDNYHNINHVFIYATDDYKLIKDGKSVGRWRVKEGLIKKKQYYEK